MNDEIKKFPVKQHYIPQFILKNFCFNDHLLYFYSLNDKRTSIKNTRDVFMERNLYTSITLNPDNPTQIETDFARYEREISTLIKTKILDKHEIFLTLKEETSLRFFCALLGFRSANAKDIFLNLDEEGKTIYKPYLQEDNFAELWRRNLSYLVNCRSFDEVVDCENIDKPIKAFMIKDCFGLFGKYFVFFERRGPIDFIIGDCYPVVINGSAEEINLSMDMISYYAITPALNMALVNNGAEQAPCMLAMKKYLKKPFEDNGILKYKTQKLYERDIRNINDGTLINSKYGVAFQDKTRRGINE